MSGLMNRRVVVTRAPHQADDIARLLCERGAEALPYPCIDQVPPEDTRALDDALRRALAGEFEWIVLTSTNTVRALVERLDTARLPDTLRAAAVGSATAALAQSALGLTIEVIPDTYLASALAEALPDLQGMRVWLPQSEIAERLLAESLVALGADVTNTTAYRTVVGSGGVDLPALLGEGRIDAITFTSASTVNHLMTRLEREGGDVRLLKRVCLACIGTKTAEAVYQHHLHVAVVPDQHTFPALIEALDVYFSHEDIQDAD